MSAAKPPYYRFSHKAMTTEWEILIADEHERIAANAALAAFRDLESLEDELSRFRPESDISRLGHMRAGATFHPSLAAFDCLDLAKDVFDETGGAFDISVAPLMNIWRHKDGAPLHPTDEDIADALARCGMRSIRLNRESLTVEVLQDFPSLDLGGIGKGYALDQMADVLRQHEVTRALLHAGTSTLLAMEAPDGEPGWIVGADTEVTLFDRALSGSGFDVKGEHVIDPRSGRPVRATAGQVWALAPTAALADALSTAFLVMTREEIDALCERHAPDLEARFSPGFGK